MMSFAKIAIYSLLFFSFVQIHAQPITRRDNDEVKLLATRKVEKGLNDLFNTLSFEDLGEFERKSIIIDSYSTSNNKLFYNGEVIIEDDIQPDHVSSKNVLDLPIEKYLTNLDLFYTKSTERTIEFSDFSVSNLKKADYYYVKVFFTSWFKGKNKQSSKEYEPTKRVAEVRAERNGKKWLVSISRVAFITPNDSINSTQNEVALVAVDSLENAAAEAEAAAERLREQERLAEKKALEEYNQLLLKGDQAFAAKDYDEAIKAYSQADKRNIYDDLLPRRKIYQVKRALEKSFEADRALIREYSVSAEVARKQRNYDEAIVLYRKILEKRPDSLQLQVIVKELTQKNSTKTEFDEKFAVGNYKELIKDYDRILKQDKDDSDWYLGRAKCYIMLADDERAMKDLNKSIEIDFANLAALLARAELYQKQKNYPKAVADYSASLSIVPKNAELYARRGAVRVKTNNLKNALEDYDKAIELTPKNPQFFFERGILRFNNKAIEPAISDFSEAIILRPEHPDAFFYRGFVLSSLKKYKEAGSDFKKSRELKLNDLLVEKIDSIALNLYQKGISQNGQPKEAIAFFSDAIDVSSNFPLAFYERGKAQMLLKAYPKAIEDFTTSLQLDNKNHQAFYQRALAWYASQKFDKAMADFQQTTNLVADYYPGMLGEADALMRLGKYEHAIVPLLKIKAAQKKIEKDYSPSFFREAYQRLGRCEYETKAHEKAIEDYSTALDFDKRNAEVFYARGQAYEANGQLDKAIEDYGKSIEIEPGFVYKYLAKGMALEKKGEFLKAINEYSNAIDADKERSNSTRLIVQRGNCWYQLGRYEKSIKDLDHDLVKDKNELCGPECRVMAGYSYLYLGQTDEGMARLQTCVGIPEVKGKAAYGLACGQLAKQNETEALVLFDKAFQTREFTASFVKKDKLLDLVKRDFRRNKDFKKLIDQYLK